MTSSSFLIKPQHIIVADASVMINLHATGRARDIIQAIPNRYAVTINAMAELESGTKNGHDDARQLQALVDSGLVDLVCLSEEAGLTYERLIQGHASSTLDDGEAATVGHALQIGGLAVLDERKARNLCAREFASLDLGCTADILLHESVEIALGAQGQVMAILQALRRGRMRVPADKIDQIVTLIGPENAAGCSSIPKARRSRVA